MPSNASRDVSLRANDMSRETFLGTFRQLMGLFSNMEGAENDLREFVKSKIASNTSLQEGKRIYRISEG